MDEVNQIKTSKLQSYLEIGKKYFQQKDYPSAIEQYHRTLKNYPKEKEVFFEIGKTYYVLSDYLKAIKFLKNAIKLDSNNEHAHFILAKAYKEIGNYNDSIKELQKLREICYKTFDLDNELISVYREKYEELIDISKFNGDYDLATREYEEKLKINPRDEKNISHLLQLYNFQGKYELTKKKASRVLNFMPDTEVFFKNKILNELEIAEGKIILSSKIRRLCVTLSNKCNLSCIMCITHNAPWEIPKKVIKEIYSLFPYLEKIMWQGGEVFVLDYFDEILSYAFQFPNLKQNIVTNGQLITEKMAEKLVKNNVELTFSIDGVTKDIYEYIRRGANFETLIRNLNLILKLRKSYNSNMILNLNVAIMKSNYHQLERFIDFAKEYSFGFICLMPIHIHLKTREDIFTNQDMKALNFITEVSPNMEMKAREYGIRLENRLSRLAKGNTKRFLNKRGDGKLLCHIPWQQLLIDYDGTVRPDCLCKIEKSAGSLLENHSLKEIWNNEVMQEYRKRIFNHNYLDLCNQNCITGKIAETHLKFP